MKTIVNGERYANILMRIAGVLKNWERGDLAGAVNRLQGAMEESGVSVELGKPVVTDPASNTIQCPACQLKVKSMYFDGEFVFCPMCMTIYPVHQ